MSEIKAILYYVHDPMCSWCWAWRPVWLELRRSLPSNMAWKYVLGGLAPDSDELMPEQTRKMIQQHWRQIQCSIGTPFNFDFWTDCQPRRDTYKACRAVVAAARQNGEEAMIEAIQKAYYLRAMNPSEPGVLATLAQEIGLNKDRFTKDLLSDQVQRAFQQQLALRDRLGVRSFPGLRIQVDGQLFSIQHDYHSVVPVLDQLERCLENHLKQCG